MTARHDKSAASRDPAGEEPRGIPEPINVVDGIPDRSPRRAAWKYLLLAAIFLLWLAFLVYCQLA